MLVLFMLFFYYYLARLPHFPPDYSPPPGSAPLLALLRLLGFPPSPARLLGLPLPRRPLPPSPGGLLGALLGGLPLSGDLLARFFPPSWSASSLLSLQEGLEGFPGSPVGGQVLDLLEGLAPLLSLARGWERCCYRSGFLGCYLSWLF